MSVAGAWQRIGRPHGRICCFSFHPRKLLTTGDGGMLTTSDPALDRGFRMLRHHGMSISDHARHLSDQVVFEEYSSIGHNFRMTDLQAAVGRVQLRRVPAMVASRRALADGYAQLLAPISGVGLPREPDWARTNWQTYSVRLPAKAEQRRVMATMLEAGVPTRRGVMCAHREPAYAEGGWRCRLGPGACGCAPRTCRQLANGEHLQDQSIQLPMFDAMTRLEQERVAEALAGALREAA